MYHSGDLHFGRRTSEGADRHRFKDLRFQEMVVNSVIGHCNQRSWLPADFPPVGKCRCADGFSGDGSYCRGPDESDHNSDSSKTVPGPQTPHH